jgi:hypothetical protein
LDPNLTYPVFLNASINATIAQSPSNPIKDWLPSIISIAVVIIGGFITYFVTVQIEKQKKEYELKKEVYFGVLNTIVEMRQKWKDLDKLKIQVPVDEKWKDLDNLKKQALVKDYDTLIRYNRDLEDLLALNRMKIGVCGGHEILRVFDEATNVLSKVPGVESIKKQTDFLNIVYTRLIPAMEDDLMRSRKHWWQFWK